MKIAILIRKYDKSSGGLERYCVELTEKLAAIHDIHVFAQEFSVENSLTQFHKIPKFFEKPRFINQLIFSLLTKKATHGKFVIVHSHELVTHANVYTIHVPCFKSIWIEIGGLKKVLRIINTFISPRKILYLWLENKQMKQINNKKFISVSEYLARNIYQCYPDIQNISIVHPGISEDFTRIEEKKLRNELSIPSNSFLILLVANDFIKKGVPTSIRSIELLNNKNIHLIVAGKGRISKINIPDSISNNIHFLGQITNMRSIYSEADLLIHPTLVDTFGMAPLEAMSMNIPVILSNMQYCGFSEHLDESEAIILNNPKDEVELAKQIDFLYRNDSARNKIAKKGNIKSKSINWDNALHKTQEIYDLIKI